jgi:phosphohistidine phosphatase SixA
MKRSLILVTLAVSTLLTAFAQGGDRKTRPVTVFLLRHAEKVVEGNPSDPELTAVGERRAEALGRLLGNAGVTHLFATEFRRTRSSLFPLAEIVGLEVQTLSAGGTGDQIAALQALPPGSLAVVAGHSNTVPIVVKGLGGELRDLTGRGFLHDDAYDRLFLVTLPVGEEALARTIELRYGEPDRRSGQ